MTVAEFIKELEKYPSDTLIVGAFSEYHQTYSEPYSDISTLRCAKNGEFTRCDGYFAHKDDVDVIIVS